MNTRHKPGLPFVTSIAIALAVALGLSACGGGGEASAPLTSADSVPTSAGASTQSFSDYAKGLKPTDIIEPLKLQQFLPPVSDTTEPFSIG